MQGTIGWLRWGLWTALVWLSTAQAQLTIEITKGVEGALPMAVVPFQSDVAWPPEQDIAAIVGADLQRSGRFAVLPSTQYFERPGRLNDVDYRAWKDRRIDHLAVGQIRATDNGRYEVRFALVDVLRSRSLVQQSFTIESSQMRRLAHHISDQIYQKLTGERGAFNTRIAYISATRRTGDSVYELSVADADGYNPRTVLRSNQPLMSPSWSPDGRQLAYVSFENRRAQIVIQTLATGSRTVVSSAPGINGAPSWSPDGQRLALTLSKDGDAEIYSYHIRSGALSRLTYNSAIDTEPVWSPDGQSIVFTSDRGGNPQLYRLLLPGGQVQRLTFTGDYNAAAAISADGRTLALVHRRGGRFYIAVANANGQSLRLLTPGGLDESPSFAPNNRMILYATSEAGRGVLAAVSVDGRVRQRLALVAGDVREPAWSPYLQ